MSYQVALFDGSGDRISDLGLADGIFGIVPNEHEMHRALIRQLPGWRPGTHSTLTRAEVAGGGKKPWRQKGTGRARQGSIRSPLWRHGGVIFGPKPRDYSKELPRKIRRLALRSALAARREDVIAIASWEFERPRTKKVKEILNKIGAVGKVLLIINEPDELLEKSSRNLQGVKLIIAGNLNVKDIMGYDKLVITKAALARIEEVFAS
ncbi:MAG: 50S ribosomal protein L4 [Cyanobacteria bacterium NC_groundwater_1444_Ag_S-0.65um_54_12]|nr:50S ribosomal protein L4 [Cyanobacteria bacterium NC_groundwater_1444_Ag_S-0.65um_54_12]